MGQRFVGGSGLFEALVLDILEAHSDTLSPWQSVRLAREKIGTTHLSPLLYFDDRWYLQFAMFVDQLIVEFDEKLLGLLFPERPLGGHVRGLVTDKDHVLIGGRFKPCILIGLIERPWTRADCHTCCDAKRGS